MRNLIRILLAVAGVPLAAAITALQLYTVWQPELPTPIAVHWQNGVVDSSADPSTFVTILVVATVVLALAFSLLITWSVRKGHGIHRFGAAACAAIATLPSAAVAMVLIANKDAEDWRNAGDFLFVLLGPFAGVIGAGVLAAVIAPTWTRNRENENSEPPSVGLKTGERAVWSGGTTNHLLAWAFVLVPVVLSGIWLAGIPVSIYAFIGGTVAAALASLTSSRVRVRVDGSGVTARVGLLRRHFPLSRITSADTAKVSFWTGLGVRVNPLTGDTAYKVRGGEALMLQLGSSRRVYFTVDRPAQAAGLLNDLLADANTTRPA